MYRYCVACLVLASLGGCATSPPVAEPGVVAAASLEPTAAESVAAIPTAGQAQALTTAVAATPSALKESSDQICEQTTLPGSRIVVGQRCYSPSARAANTRSQLDELRRDQEMRERGERDREQQRQRASMQAAFPQ